MRSSSFGRVTVVGSFVLALHLSSCASHPRVESVALPRFIELQEEPAIATFHFPRGLYSLDSEDGSGSYYRAPRRIIKHSFAGFAPYDGGLFVDQRTRKVRGYVIWAGGLTKIGSVSPRAVKFRN